MQVLVWICRSSIRLTTHSRLCRAQEWFGHLARVGLAAEHGYWFRPAAKHPLSQFKAVEDDDDATVDPLFAADGVSISSTEAVDGSVASSTTERDSTLLGQANGDDDDTLATDSSGPPSPEHLESVPWQCMFSDVELEWRDEVESILEHFTERTPGSLLDIKDCSYTWHFRDADPEFGLKQAKDLQLHFDQMLRDRPVGIVMCRIKKYVTIRPWRVNKGRAVSRILEYESETPYFTSLDSDFILAVGDERTDEDMFNVVQGSNCYTCTVGMKVSRAQYYLDDPDDVLRVLTAMTNLQADRQAP